MRRVVLLPSEHVITPPTVEPIDLDQAKLLLQTDSDTDDTLIAGWMHAAVQQWESLTATQLMTATLEDWLDGFPHYRGAIELTRPPLQAVLSITYVDEAGTLQTLDSSLYTVTSAANGPKALRGVIEPVIGVQWPQTACQRGAVRVRFLAGYGNAVGDVPALIRDVLFQWVKGAYCSARCVSDKPQVSEVSPLGRDQIVRDYSSLSQVEMVQWRPW